MQREMSMWRAWVVVFWLLLVVGVRPLAANADDGRSQVAGVSSPRGDDAKSPLAGPLTLREAIERGMKHHLTVLGLTHDVDAARGAQRVVQSALAPHFMADVSAIEQNVNLTALGVRLETPIPGVAVPDVSGPFGIIDVRARLTQAVIDLPALYTSRAARETLRASELTLLDARSLIAHVVGLAYLDAMAARAKLDAARAQLETATAIHQRAAQQQAAGLATALDVTRAEVQVLVERQRFVALEAGLAKRRIMLARLIGLPLAVAYELPTTLTVTPSQPLTLDQAVAQAADRRADLQAAEARWQAAERTHAAARAARFPSAAVSGDYGANRASGSPTYSTFTVVGVVRVPLWLGGRTQGDVTRTAAVLSRRRVEADDLRAQIEGDVRMAFVDLEAAASQVEVSRATLQVARDGLALARQRFDAGLSDNVAVVQAQQAVAKAELDHIDSVVAHGQATLGLARSIGAAGEDFADHLRIP